MELKVGDIILDHYMDWEGFIYQLVSVDVNEIENGYGIVLKEGRKHSSTLYDLGKKAPINLKDKELLYRFDNELNELLK